MLISQDTYIAVDLETTGLSPYKDQILEIGALKVEGGEVTASFEQIVDPGIPVPPYITNLTGITQDMLQNCPDASRAVPDFLEFAGTSPLLGHNLSFDYGFIRQGASRLGISYSSAGLDTLRIAKICLPDLESRSLDQLAAYFSIPQEHHHRALDDALTAARLFERLSEEFSEKYPQLFCPCEMQVRVKRETPATPAQKRYLTSLLRQHGLSGGIDVERLTRNEASRMIDSLRSGSLAITHSS